MRHQFKKLLFMLIAVGASSVLQADNSDCCTSNRSCNTICEKTNFTGHTFFSVRPQFQSSSPELITLFRGDRARLRCDGFGGALEFTVFGGRSTNPEKMAQYFMPFGKTELVAGEFGSDAVRNGTADVIANYFGVLTAANGNGANTFDLVNPRFESKISFRPQQSVFGLGIAWRHSFAGECDQGWFIQISTPIERVRNQLAFNETLIRTTTVQTIDGFVTNMTDAFCGKPVLNFGPAVGDSDDAVLTFPGGTKAFNYGKIDCSSSSNCCNSGITICNNDCNRCDGTNNATSGPCNSRIKWGLADIEVNVGYEWFNEEHCYSNLWAGLVLPTGNKPGAEFIFEPVVGNNKHFAVSLGGVYGYELWSSHDDCDRSLWIEVNMVGRYFASNTQKRSFDLVDKQWSRYIWVYPSRTSIPFVDIQPGINYFTQDMRVSPRFDRDCNTAFVYKSPCFEAEVGYNFYARSGEDVRLCNPNVLDGVGIAGFQIGNIIFPTALTASNATIRRFFGIQTDNVFDSSIFGGVPQYVPIKPEDINLASAAAPCTLTHTIYGSIGKTWDYCDYPTFAGVGGSYEFSADNSGLDRWLVWFKFGFSY